MEITLRQFLEAAVVFTGNPRCVACATGKIELRYLGEESDPITWFYVCNNIRCMRQYELCYAYSLANLPRGR